MKRLLKKTFPFFLLGMSLIIVYLHDSTDENTRDYLYTSYTNGSSIFSIHGNDVIVLLHIPGTGMTSLSQSLVKDLITDTPCICYDTKTRCTCKNREGNHWLFQSYNSTGFVCGEHADWTTLTECAIDQWMENAGHDTRRTRRYWMVTLLREPAARFIQEWHHFVTRDAYFRNEPRLFRNESPELQKKELACWVGKRIASLSLKEFIDCEENPALNRMTRMLANMTYVNSLGYHGDKYETSLLQSAIENLEQIPFFGIADNSVGTQDLLDTTFGFRLARQLDLLPPAVYKSPTDLNVPVAMKRSVRLANHLDVRLYEHALRLFQRQMKEVKVEHEPGTLNENSKIRNLNGDEKEDNGGPDEHEAYRRDGDDDENYDDDEDDDIDAEEEYSNEQHERKLIINESDLDPDKRSYFVSDDKRDRNKVADILVKDEGGDDGDQTQTNRESLAKWNAIQALQDPHFNDEYDGGDDDDDVFVPVYVSDKETPKVKPRVPTGKTKIAMQESELEDEDDSDYDTSDDDFDAVEKVGKNIHDNMKENTPNEMNNGKEKTLTQQMSMEKDKNDALNVINVKPRDSTNDGANQRAVDTEDVNVFFSMLQDSKEKSKQQPQYQSQNKQQQLQLKQEEQPQQNKQLLPQSPKHEQEQQRQQQHQQQQQQQEKLSDKLERLPLPQQQSQNQQQHSPKQQQQNQQPQKQQQLSLQQLQQLYVESVGKQRAPSKPDREDTFSPVDSTDEVSHNREEEPVEGPQLPQQVLPPPGRSQQPEGTRFQRPMAVRLQPPPGQSKSVGDRNPQPAGNVAEFPQRPLDKLPPELTPLGWNPVHGTRGDVGPRVPGVVDERNRQPNRWQQKFEH